jgi:hypothetical protein
LSAMLEQVQQAARLAARQAIADGQQASAKAPAAGRQGGSRWSSHAWDHPGKQLPQGRGRGPPRWQAAAHYRGLGVPWKDAREAAAGVGQAQAPAVPAWGSATTVATTGPLIEEVSDDTPGAAAASVEEAGALPRGGAVTLPPGASAAGETADPNTVAAAASTLVYKPGPSGGDPSNPPQMGAAVVAGAAGSVMAGATASGEPADPKTVVAAASTVLQKPGPSAGDPSPGEGGRRSVRRRRRPARPAK